MVGSEIAFYHRVETDVSLARIDTLQYIRFTISRLRLTGRVGGRDHLSRELSTTRFHLRRRRRSMIDPPSLD